MSIDMEEDDIDLFRSNTQGTLVFADFTQDDYEKRYRPALRKAVYQLLTVSPKESAPISFEKVYSCVYRCVCKQYAMEMHQDLIEQITIHLLGQSEQLLQPGPKNFVEHFAEILCQYCYALGGIVPIFNYLNKYYVQLKLNSNLETELRNLFITTIGDRHIHTVIDGLLENNLKPFTVRPEVACKVVKTLYNFKPDYANLHPNLFAKYIPGVLGPCRLDDLDTYIREAKEQQAALAHHPDYFGGDQSRKRPLEADD